ncbi:hypothetical protein BHMPCIPO_03238 [Ensifer sesbaniae]|nr:hypothetical protein [Ensifer sesbaniae]
MIVLEQFTPLWPAGHLPHTGGDRPAADLSPRQERFRRPNVSIVMQRAPHLFSPLVGEMAGRPEGGNAALLNASSLEAR